MREVTYVRADSPADALDRLGKPDAAPIAGGTELVNLLKEDIAAPDTLVDINGLDLSGIDVGPSRLHLGALARMSDVAANSAVRRDYPVIAQALERSASPQLRNMASMGGNLLQRTRCPYFRADHELPCNKRAPGSGCAARHGDNRTAAVFGWSEHCVATHPSDLAVALAALDAQVTLRATTGTRTVPVTEFHRLPGDEPRRDTVLVPGELITGIDVPAGEAAAHSHYLKLRERASYEFALVSVAACAVTDGGVLTAARLALGGVAAKPWRLTAAEDALPGTPLRADALRAAVEPAFTDARPLTGNGFKIELALRAVVRALLAAGGPR